MTTYWRFAPTELRSPGKSNTAKGRDCIMTAGEGACIMDGLERFSISGGVNWISTPGAGEKGVGCRPGRRGEAAVRAAADGVPPPVSVFRFSAFVSLCVYVLSCTTGLSGLKNRRAILYSLNNIELNGQGAGASME